MSPFSVPVLALLLGTLSIAALHALIPSHWLAFALVGRSQRWTLRKTLTVTALAGGGHVLMTLLLGLVVSGAGKALQKAIPEHTEHAVTALLLILLGGYFLWNGWRERGCCHEHHHNDGEGENSRSLVQRVGEAPTVMGALVLGMTLSPCLDLLSVFVAASNLDWAAIFLACLLMTVTTLGIMLLLVALTFRGLQRLNLRWLEQNEGLVVGSTLIALGILLFFV